MLQDLRRLLSNYCTDKGFGYLDVSSESHKGRLYVRHIFTDRQYGTSKFQVVASELADWPVETCLFHVDGGTWLVRPCKGELLATRYQAADFGWLENQSVELFTLNTTTRELTANYYFAESFFKYLSGRFGRHGIHYQDGQYVLPDQLPTILFSLARLEA
jgi:hypothetical protein